MKTKDYKKMILTALTESKKQLEYEMKHQNVFTSKLLTTMISNNESAISTVQTTTNAQMSKLREQILTDELFVFAVLHLFKYINFTDMYFDVSKMKEDNRLAENSYSQIFKTQNQTRK